MWKCPICGAEVPTVTICARCGFDGSRDYEHYPTVFTAVSARNIQALRAEWERQKQPQPQPQNGGQNGDTPITAQAQAPVSAAPAQPMPQQSPAAPVQPAAAPSRKKSGLIVGICSAVVILVLLAKVLTGADTPAADTSSNVPDITVPEVVVQEPGIANCEAYYVDWYADDEPYALVLTATEDSDAEPVTAEQLQAMIDTKGCTMLRVEHFDNADGALWYQIGKLTGIECLCIDYCTTSDLELLSDMRDLQDLYFSCTQAHFTGRGNQRERRGHGDKG